MRITPFQRRRPTIRRKGEVGPVDLDGTPLSAMKKIQCLVKALSKYEVDDINLV